MRNSTENGKDELLSDFNQVVSETQGLLDSMKNATSEKTAQLRASLERNLEATRQRLTALQATATERATAAARATDDYVRESPWTAVGVAAGIGVLVGLLLSSTMSNDRR
jgi:ElaB/YqjD/DUF883 family membrane-anchored ribosome-binding protein